MSITVIYDRPAAAGRSSDLLATAVEALGAELDLKAALRAAYLIQDHADPAVMMYVGHWEDYDGYTDALLHSATLQRIVPLCREPGVPRFFRTVTRELTREEPAAFADCVRIRCASADTAPVVDYLEHRAAPRLLRQPGVLWRHLYEAIDEPGELLAIHGWRTVHECERYVQSADHPSGPHLQELGADVEHLAGRVQGRVRLTR